MKLVNTEDVSSVAKRLTVEIEAEQVTKALDDAYKKVGRQARIKGFRPGKVPRTVLERYYGPDVGQEVAQQLISTAAPEALEASELTPITQPQVETLGTMKPGESMEFTLMVETAPEIELGEYFGLEVERPERQITDEMISGKLEDIRSMHASLEAVEEGEAAADGDTVLTDLAASEDGAEVEGGSFDGFSIALGQGRFHPDVEAALIGKATGDKVEVEAEFASDFFHDALAGKKLTVAVEVKEVKRTVLPELDDEFAKTMGDQFETVDALTDAVREEMEKSAERDSERAVNDAILDQLLDGMEFEVPEGLVDLEMKNMFEQVERSLMMRGMNMQAAVIDPSKLEEDLKPQALRRCQEDLILNAVADKEGLEVDDDDLKEGFEELAQAAGQTPEEVRKFHEERDLVDGFNVGLLKTKTLKRLIAEAKITVVDAPEETDGEEADGQAA